MSATKDAGEVRVGIIGLGNMGATHARNILEGKTTGVRLTAVCDRTLGRIKLGDDVREFTEPAELIRSGLVDGVIVATPHALHPAIGIDALGQGLHVLMEKPIAIHKSDCERLIAAHTGPQVFAAVFNQRTDPFFRKIRELIQGGELGEIRRVSWIITNWFRTEAYYAQGGWRATWAGEGGGVLLNQSPHNLDLLQWLCGMPNKVRAYCRFGRYHEIEVEDEVTAYLEFPGGASGVFITSTGEAPGTNRLEISAERGKIVYEDDRLVFTRNEVEMSAFSRTAENGFAAPATEVIEFPISGHGDQHAGIVNNFAAAILHGEPLIAPAAEGVHSVELANAMIYSTLIDSTVELPMDGKAYAAELDTLVAASKAKAKEPSRKASAEEFAKSFR